MDFRVRPALARTGGSGPTNEGRSYWQIMDFTTLERRIPVDSSYDVIVVGGGPAGCAAAASAARDGARTLLVEQSGMLGGSGTSALVPAWCPFSDKEQVIYRGLAERILEKCKAGMPQVPSGAVDWIPIDAERLKRIYDDVVTESGAQILFHTFLSTLDTGQDGQVERIVVANKRGLSAFAAKVFIDCTGDGDLAAWAGAPAFKGDEAGDMMPATHCFVLTNVDEFAFQYGYDGGAKLNAGNPDSPVYKVIESGRYPLIADAHMCATLVGPRTVGFNAGHMWNVDNTDPWSISKALTHGRKMARQYRDALAEFCPDAFANAYLAITGSVVGIRETRRIIGDYVLTLDDYIARRSFDDEICRNCYFIDIHHALDDVAKNNKERKAGLKNTIGYGAGESHGIPYRCLTPKNLKNVLIAGRSLSCERVVQGSIRVMPACLAVGEAAGAAAAQAIASGNADLHALDVASLRRRLRAAGAYLPDRVLAR